ncbi:DUF5309 family protein [Xinfangfangia sp. CPCC 101601]|uniref:DUF5309 family protein n=1 Tax=Pseudogemmobacter lacusdianii TaxID=3069608 RepID=A0ABU0VYA9_9RHOB|nr:DUF5309 family protein [Xinfangfangia sp. CPCC 101601]MDQ2066740.1 DUF5309 family protein [Xinfangfangia sp. CPCC 101601]
MPTHLKTFDLVGKKEEVSDYISMITPSDTPFLSSIKTETVENTLYQWMEDQLRAVAKNAKLEGADAADSNRDQPTMRQNGTQILEETFKVSGTADAVKLYGRDKVTARETMKTGKLLKMDLEHSLVGTGQTYVAAAGAVAGEFAGVQAQIDSAVTVTIDSDGSTAGNQAGPLTETAVISAHEKLYNAGSDATTLMIKPSDSKLIAGWLQSSGRTHTTDNGDTKLTNVVNVYESPFGTVRVVKNRRLRASDALLYDPANWKLAVLKGRNWFREKLAKVGDAERWMMLGEFGLKHNNKQATALITNLT